jgi:hypothetical protein
MLGENADYSRTLKGLMLRWQYWMMKWKLLLSICKNCTMYNFLTFDTNILQHLYTKTQTESKKRDIMGVGKHHKLIKPKKFRIIISTNILPTFHMFCFMTPKGRKLCDFRIAEIEEDLEDYFHIVQSESKDEVKQKMKIDYISGMLKNLRLKDEYNLITTGKGVPYIVLLN